VKYARTVVGYHGCDATVAARIWKGEPFRPSSADFDWLGRGVYFWEYGEDRALRWAQGRSQHQSRAARKAPAVIGAIIQLGTCFDLLDTRSTHSLATAFLEYRKRIRDAGAKMPTNSGTLPENERRFLDCAVLNLYIDQARKAGTNYQTVRGGFVEGPPAFEGSSIQRETHIQIAVRDPDCILGVFRPRLAL
jgi:hypothetical protein